MEHIYNLRGSGNGFSQLWENREALDKYLARLKELMEEAEKQRSMQNNLELHKLISFDELVEHGLKNGANVDGGFPWSWKINGKAITHENNNCYIIETIDGMKYFYRNDSLIAYESGLKILIDHGY